MNNILPIVKKVEAKTIAEDIMDIRPDETLEQAKRRFLKEKRKEKLEKIFGDELYE